MIGGKHYSSELDGRSKQFNWILVLKCWSGLTFWHQNIYPIKIMINDCDNGHKNLVPLILFHLWVLYLEILLLKRCSLYNVNDFICYTINFSSLAIRYYQLVFKEIILTINRNYINIVSCFVSICHVDCKSYQQSFLSVLLLIGVEIH